MHNFPLPQPKAQFEITEITGNKFKKAFDPITNRIISSVCWNGSHECKEDEIEADALCIAEECKCLCHDHNPIESGPPNA